MPHLRSFFFNDPATTALYTLSLHDALPISIAVVFTFAALSGLASAHKPYQDWLATKLPWTRGQIEYLFIVNAGIYLPTCPGDRKSTRLNSSHGYISYAVFCLKKKKSCRRTTMLMLLSADLPIYLTPSVLR